MGKDKKILLYRIDEQDKNVIFIITENNEKAWGDIAEDNQTVLSFDDVFRDITEFRDGFLDYEQLTDELIGVINGRHEVYQELLAKFDDNRLNSFNFFTRYYSDTLREVFTAARADIDKAGALFNTLTLKKSTEYVESVFNHIRKIMRDDWNFDFNSESELQIMKISCDKIIIRGNDRNEIYTVADTALVNFFYDFSFVIHKLKLYVCNCKYCDKKFLGKKNSVCCNHIECKEIYQREQRNARRRERDNGTHQIYITRLSNYIGQQKTKLPPAIIDDPTLLEKFDKQRKVFMQIMRNKIDEYEAENRLPDEELNRFYDRMKQEVVRFVYSLESER